ncbi:MAG: hypothetical protein ACSLFK_08515 [Gemmatimonadaceae bacterium]
MIMIRTVISAVPIVGRLSFMRTQLCSVVDDFVFALEAEFTFLTLRGSDVHGEWLPRSGEGCGSRGGRGIDSLTGRSPTSG